MATELELKQQAEIEQLHQDLEHMYIDFMTATISMVLSNVEMSLELRDRAEEVLKGIERGAFRQRIQELRIQRAEALAWQTYQKELNNGG